MFATLCNAANASADDSDMATAFACAYFSANDEDSKVEALVADIDFYRDAVVRDNIEVNVS